MAIRFLMGEDIKFFDYSSVDNNEKYDDIELINRDCEEKYFDEEEANDVSNSEYTGVQDY